MTTRRQIWFCLDCKKCGEVEYLTGEGAYDVITRVRNAHWAPPELFKTDVVYIPCNGSPRLVLEDTGSPPRPR